MRDELDLASLVKSVPETEDSLAKQDDAPIIRLINALLVEAIREDASDIREGSHYVDARFSIP